MRLNVFEFGILLEGFEFYLLQSVSKRVFGKFHFR